MIAIPVTATYVGILAIVALVLAGLVGRARIKSGVSFGDGGNEELQRAIRVQGNFLEYVPMALLLILVLEIMGAWVVALNILGSALVLARLAHAWGLGRDIGANPGRSIGTLVTFLVILIAAIWALLIGIGVI